MPQNRLWFSSKLFTSGLGGFVSLVNWGRPGVMAVPASAFAFGVFCSSFTRGRFQDSGDLGGSRIFRHACLLALWWSMRAFRRVESSRFLASRSTPFQRRRACAIRSAFSSLLFCYCKWRMVSHNRSVWYPAVNRTPSFGSLGSSSYARLASRDPVFLRWPSCTIQG